MVSFCFSICYSTHSILRLCRWQREERRLIGSLVWHGWRLSKMGFLQWRDKIGTLVRSS